MPKQPAPLGFGASVSKTARAMRYLTRMRMNLNLKRRIVMSIIGTDVRYGTAGPLRIPVCLCIVSKYSEALPYPLA